MDDPKDGIELLAMSEPYTYNETLLVITKSFLHSLLEFNAFQV